MMSSSSSGFSIGSMSSVHSASSVGSLSSSERSPVFPVALLSSQFLVDLPLHRPELLLSMDNPNKAHVDCLSQVAEALSVRI